MEQKEQLQIIGHLYTEIYRVQAVLQQLQSTLGEKEKVIAEQKLSINTLETELDKSKTTISEFKQVAHNDTRSD